MPPLRIAHRGASREHPENTLPAFRRALELGADGIELDVHATRDGMVVVHHDPELRSTLPTAALAGRPVAELEWSQVATHEVASGVRVPTLGDVLTLVGPRAVVFVEIKGRGIEERVVATIRAGAARCAIHSFDHDTVARAAELASDIPRGLLFDQYPEDPARSMRVAGARDLWPHWSLVDSRLVERVHDVGGRVIAWTVNEPEAVESLRELRVDGLCSDDVRLLS